MPNWTRKLALLFRRKRFRSELAEEMDFHRAEAKRRFEAEGMSAEAARRAAKRVLGNETRLREQSNEIIGFRWESVLQDLRYAIRQMIHAPGFALTAIFTLALGIGASTAIFSLVHAALLRDLPYPSAERIVSIQDQRVHGASSGGLVGVPRFFDLAARNKSFESLTFFYYEHPTLIAGSRLPENLDGIGATGQFFRVFGAQPLLGRTFDEHDDVPKAPEVAVLSHAAWQQFFAGDPKAIGTVVTIDKTPTTIIGVMPSTFNYPAGNQLWRPTHFAANQWNQYRGDGVRFANVFGRVRPGVSLAEAEAEVNLIGNQLQTEHAESDGPWRFRTEGLRDLLYGSAKPALLVLMAASLLLLLIACINVANLLLSRATTRRREVALRQALGASQGRLIQQYLIESLVLTLLGAGAGLAAAVLLVRVAAVKLPGALHEAGAVALDWPLLWFSLALALVTGIVFGLVPLHQSPFRRREAGNINMALKRGESHSSGAAGSKLRDAFVAVQVGLSLVLLVGACLLAQSLWRLTQTSLGFQPDHVLMVPIKLPWSSNGDSSNRFFEETQRRLEQLPGVNAVGQTTSAPTEGYNFQNSYDADWLPHTPHQDAVRAEVRAVAGNYWQAMDIPVLAGRELRNRDKAILVNQEFVRQYLNGQSPLGHHLIYDKTTTVEIVGVVGNVRGTTGSIVSQVRPELYFAADSGAGRTFVLRTRLPDEQLGTLITAIREQVHQVDPQQAIGEPQTLGAVLSSAVATPRLNMSIMIGFAVIALLLACVGIYGVVAYSVAQRRQEIGVRMALGSTRGQISRLFLRRTMTSAMIGLSAGTVAALLLTRLLRSQLYGVEPKNPATYLIAVVLLLIPVLAACLRPALKAASVDPVEALRAE